AETSVGVGEQRPTFVADDQQHAGLKRCRAAHCRTERRPSARGWLEKFRIADGVHLQALLHVGLWWARLRWFWLRWFWFCWFCFRWLRLRWLRLRRLGLRRLGLSWLPACCLRPCSATIVGCAWPSANPR